MRKFTVFTVILSIIVIVIVAEVFVDNFLPESSGQGSAQINLPKNIDLARSIKTNVTGFDNVLGEDLSADVKIPTPKISRSPVSIPDVDTEFQEELDSISDLDFLPLYGDVDTDLSAGASDFEDFEVVEDVPDFEDDQFADFRATVYLRDEQIKSAGFANAFVEEQESDGLLFKTIVIDDLPDTTVHKFLIKNDDKLFAKVYAFKGGINSEIGSTYDALKMRALAGLSTEINETNEYGGSSFYMNDSRRPSSAFLTTRVGGLIYSFSYPKELHPQIKNLIQLLMWELG